VARILILYLILLTKFIIEDNVQQVSNLYLFVIYLKIPGSTNFYDLVNSKMFGVLPCFKVYRTEQ